MKYREPLYRPPSEADSLIFQLAYGCPHNTCLFCPMYKGGKYEERNIDTIVQDIEETSKLYPETKRVFLADGDVMNLPFAILETVFLALNKNFSKLARVSMYANGNSILNKNKAQLQFLKSKKLFTLYMGLESGDENILRKVKKQDTVSGMIEAVKTAQDVGIRMSVMILLGLAGRRYSREHAEKTAEAINLMGPKFLAALRFVQAPGFAMFDDYVLVTEYGAVQELLWIIEKLELENTIFRANHSSNPVPISARFPKDKRRLIYELKNLLNSSKLDKDGAGVIPFYL